MESESPLEVLSRAATMLHREETAAAESPYVCTTSEYLPTYFLNFDESMGVGYPSVTRETYVLSEVSFSYELSAQILRYAYTEGNQLWDSA